MAKSSRFKTVFTEEPSPKVTPETLATTAPDTAEKPARRGGRRKREQPQLAKTIRVDEATDAMLKSLILELEERAGRYITEQELTVALYRIAALDARVRAQLEQRLGRGGRGA